METSVRWIGALALVLGGLVGLAAYDTDATPTSTAQPQVTSTPTPTATARAADTPVPSRATPTAMSTSPAPTPSRDLEAFFRGKTLRIVVPFSAGGGNDLTARTIARTGPKYLPGKPRIAVQNVPGGGGKRGIRFAYEQANDGTVAGQLHPRFILQPLLGQPIAGFDPLKIRLVGNLRADAPSQLVCIQRSVATSWEEAIALGRDLTFGDTSPGTSRGSGVTFLSSIGAPIKMVFGYGGTSEIAAAFDRGELDLFSCTIDEGGTDHRLYPEWLKPPTRVVPIFYQGVRPENEDRFKQLGLEIPPNIFDLPGIEYTEAQRDALDLNFKLVALGNHSLWLPPGVPDDMFNAWDQMMKMLVNDREFKKISAAGAQNVGYISGADLASAVAKVKALPPDGIALLKLLNGIKN